MNVKHGRLRAVIGLVLIALGLAILIIWALFA